MEGFAHSPEVDLKCGNSFLGMIEGSFEHPQMSSMSINDLLFFILSGEGWCVPGPNGDSKRHRTDQHGSQPRAFHLRRGRSCPTRSAGDLVILFAPMTTHSNCSTCRVVLRQIDLPVWREIKMVEDLFIDRRSMAPRWLVSRRRTDGEDRNRTYKSALGSCPYL